LIVDCLIGHGTSRHAYHTITRHAHAYTGYTNSCMQYLFNPV